MKQTKWIGALLAAALALPAFVQASALKQFETFVASSQSVSGNFAQRQVKIEQGTPRISQVSTGCFEFLRPGRFIWAYERPYHQLLHSDGQDLYIYDKDLEQVIIKKLGLALASSPAAILFGSNDLSKNFVLKEGQAKDGLEWVEATPKTKDSTFDRIGIGMKDGLPVAMELHDTFGQVSLLKFSGFKKNPDLSKARFAFDMPNGVDVLRE